MARTSKHELKVLNFLVRHYAEQYSINQFAKQLGLTPRGMQKLLKRLENQGIVTPHKIGNGIFYHPRFESEFAMKTVALALYEEINNHYAKAQAKDLERLRPFVQAAILFGSVIKIGDKAGDIDVMVVIDNPKFKAYKKALTELRALKPKPIHDVIQTFDDLVENFKKHDKVILEILKTGKILWGHDFIVSAVKEAA